MTPLGKCLVFYFRYWAEMNRLYWTDDKVEDLEDVENTVRMARAVGDECCRQVADFLEACGEDIEKQFAPKCKRVGGKGMLAKNWSISFGVWPRNRPKQWKIQLGVDIPQTRTPEVIPWLWAAGRMPGEEKLANYLRDKVHARSQELEWNPGTIALARIPILSDTAADFEVDRDPLLAKVREAFAKISKQDVEMLAGIL